MSDIRLQDITKVYGAGRSAALAVDDVSLSVASGELFFLLGPSGCGKTTLLRIIAGLIEPTRGRILIGGQDVTHRPVDRRGTAMVFQNYALWPHMTVMQNVEFAPKMQKRPRDERKRVAASNLSRVKMEAFAKRKPNQLSGGQQQRVALARALAAEDKCLLLDEPLSNLDARLRLQMRTELRRLVKAAGTTGVYVTHDQAEALSMADRIAVMNDGRIIQTGTPRELYDRPATRFVADFLGEANFLDGRVAGANGTTRVTTAAGEVVSHDAPPAEAAAVTCCIRPERIAVAAVGAEGDESMPGLDAEVVHSTYLGGQRQYLCRLADGTEWRVNVLTAGEQPLEPGARVRLRYRASDAILLTE